MTLATTLEHLQCSSTKFTLTVNDVKLEGTGLLCLFFTHYTMPHCPKFRPTRIMLNIMLKNKNFGRYVLYTNYIQVCMNKLLHITGMTIILKCIYE